MYSLNKKEILRGLPLYFEKNKGHLEENIKYSMRNKAYNTLFYENQMILCLIEENNTPDKYNKKNNILKNFKSKLIFKNTPNTNKQIEANILKFNLNNEISKLEMLGEERINAKINYKKGNEENDWINNIEAFKKLTYKEIYKSIDMIYYEKDKKLSYDFIVKPNGNPNDIKLTIEGSSNIKLNKDGDLEISINKSKVIMKKPISYQIINEEKVSVKSKFSMFKNNISFEIGQYDTNIDLIIDPVLTYYTYLGGSDEDNSTSIAVDNDLNVYITGRTFSIEFPLKNPLEVYHLSSNVFVSKINKYGNLVFSTYIGGNGIDEATSIALDDENSIYITGITDSEDFPIKNQIYNYSGNIDSFICKIRIKKDIITKEEIGELVFSTYLGGYGDDYSNYIFVDNEKCVYVTGCTSSINFPLYKEIESTIGIEDIFISKIKVSEDDKGISELLFSTTLGGDYGCAKSVAVDESKNIYITGYASTSKFPLKNELYAFAGSKNIYLIKIDIDDLVDKIKFATYIREYSGYEEANSIKVDKDKNIYITGYMIDSFTDYKHVVVYKIGSSNNLLLSKKISGNKEEEGTALEIDESKNIYITGYTTSTDFPLKNELFKYNKKKDAFIVKMDFNGKIVFSTYLGGSSDDASTAITLDKKGCIYVTGNTDSNDFYSESKLQSYMGYGDIFITKIEQARHFKIGDKELISKVSKDKISLSTAQNLICYVNDYNIETFYINEEIIRMKAELNSICDGLIGFTDYKSISIKPTISFSIALFKTDYCLDNLKIYVLEEGYITKEVDFDCIGMEDELPNFNDFEVLISSSYQVKDVVDGYYIFDILVSVGLLYRGGM